mmetsp:Transcript_693/g.1328  ORF Transcript_693/g.1328 Transcript_693/m.1328 type:complete len:107 (+) Transcript_693:256-576(+)
MFGYPVEAEAAVAMLAFLETDHIRLPCLLAMGLLWLLFNVFSDSCLTTLKCIQCRLATCLWQAFSDHQMRLRISTFGTLHGRFEADNLEECHSCGPSTNCLFEGRI